MSPVPAYRIDSLVHSYDGRVALDIPRLDIHSGEVCALVGPNGCGKSTLLSILALLMRPTSGMLYVQGSEAAGQNLEKLRKRVTLVHQKPVLFSMSVKNNVAYGLRAAGLPAGEIERRLQFILEAANLASVAEKPGRKLSGGEAQRAVLARALVLETPILLLDEPTNSLDETSKPLLVDLLRESNRTRGTTVVIATHDTAFIASLQGRIIQMEGGKIAGS